MVQSGDWVLVDLRPASRFDEAHPSGAVSVELYKEVILTAIRQNRSCEVPNSCYRLISSKSYPGSVVGHCESDDLSVI